MFLGVAVIGAAAAWEEHAYRGLPWRNAVAFINGTPEEANDTDIPIRVHWLPAAPDSWRSLLVEVLKGSPEGVKTVERYCLDKRCAVFLLPDMPEFMSSVLAAGRLPEPGQPEALAGDLGPREGFVLDGQAFTVVGRLQRGIGGLVGSYIVFESGLTTPLFDRAADCEPGWIDPVGLAQNAALIHIAQRNPEVRLAGVFRRAPSATTVGAMIGLLLAAWAGCWAHLRLFRRMAGWPGTLAPATLEMRAWPRLFAGFHVLFYGAFFAAGVLAVRYPVAATYGYSMVLESFSSGPLSDIGDAYVSASVPHAAAATFAHNYLTATILFTFIPSLFFPFSGFLKTFLSFMAVGFVIAPQWAGSTAQLVYHCITMVLELEAYIVAAFLSTVLVLRAARGLRRGAFSEEVGHALRAMLSGTVLTGLMLAAAALYEALTLILIG